MKKFESEINDFYEKNVLPNEKYLIDIISETDEDLFCRILQLATKKIKPCLTCKILKSWILNNDDNDALSILSKVNYLFKMPNFNFKQKFLFYNFLVKVPFCIWIIPLISVSNHPKSTSHTGWSWVVDRSYGSPN